MRHLPSIQDVHVVLLCGSLDGSDLLVGDHFTDVVVGDVSEAAFSDEKACIWYDRVYVLLELIQIISLHGRHPHSSGRIPIPRYPTRWRRLMMP
jgi:hypothetical protein